MRAFVCRTTIGRVLVAQEDVPTFASDGLAIRNLSFPLRALIAEFQKSRALALH
jgi:hypothetical protein